MKIGDSAVHAAGMLRSHAATFTLVAKAFDCVIVNRSCNLTGVGLIEDDYSSKGFHIKAKTSNWGPFAGFVMRDPDFVKAKDAGKKAGQEAANVKALSHGCGVVPLALTERRLEQLVQGCSTIPTPLIQTSTANEGLIKITACAAVCPGSPTSFLAYRKDVVDRGPMWFVCYDTGGSLVLDMKPADLHKFLKPLMVMTNPEDTHHPGPRRPDPMSAVSGDYDLFAVYPKKHGPNDLNRGPRSDQQKASDLLSGRTGSQAGDRAGLVSPLARMNPGASPLVKQRAKEFADSFKEHQGHEGQYDYDTLEDWNTGRPSIVVQTVREPLNAGIRQEYKGGNMVHHSDESGNPFSADTGYPDESLIFFVPGHPPRLMETLSEFQDACQRVVRMGYRVVFNPRHHVRNFLTPSERASVTPW